MLNFLFKRWTSIMIETANDCYNLKEKYAYLKANNIRCKMKNAGYMGMGADMGMGMGSTSNIKSVSLEVYYKDVEKTQQLLNNIK